jgi:colanic acid biosynthesis glycosyl transferase WcaI
VRILIYGINYAPELVGIGKYTGEMADWLSSQGHSVRIVTAPPYYPAWKIGEGYHARRYRVECNGPTRVYRCPLYIPAKASAIRRIFHLLSFALTSLPVVLWQALTWRPEVVFTVAPAFFCAPGGWLSARIGGSSAWLHVQDLELDAAFELGLFRALPIRRLATWFEARILRRFDHVSTISRPMLNQLREKGVSAYRLELFPNWVDTRQIFPAPETGIRPELGIPAESVVVLYSGNMGEKQGLEIVVEAAQNLVAHPNILFVLCGDGAARKGLENMAAGLKNVKFCPLQPTERLNGLLNSADIHLIPQRAGAADLVMPSKLTSILACGGAVITTATHWTQVARAVKEAGGCVCPPGSLNEFTQAILELSNNVEARKAMGIRSREYALNRLDKVTILGQLLAQLEPLKKQRHPGVVENAHSLQQ